MDNSKQKFPRTPEQKHHRQLMLEIFLPLAIAILVFAGLAILSVFLTGTNGTVVAQWADISLILMVFPLMLICLILIVAGFFINRALINWNKSLPDFFISLRASIDKNASSIQSIASALASPMIMIKSTQAAILQFFTQLFPTKK